MRGGAAIPFLLLVPVLTAQNASVLIYDPMNGGASAGYYNNDGTFSYSLIPANSGFANPPLGDFNGDGKADILFYDYSTLLGYVGIDGAGEAFNFGSLFWSPGYNFIKAGDFNHDGRTDFLLYNGASGAAYIALAGNAGSGCSYDGNFSYCRVTVPSGGPFTSVVVADFNGDGYADLFLYNGAISANGQAWLGISNGLGGLSFSNVSGLSTSYTQVVTGDLNGDGKADLVLYNGASGLTATGMSSGTGFNFASQTYSQNFTTVLPMDYNGDGRADLILYNSSSGVGYLGIGSGAGGFAFVSLFWSPGYDNVYALDVNGDGKTDVVLYSSASGTAYVGSSPGGTGSDQFHYTYSFWGTGKNVAVSSFPLNAPAIPLLSDNGAFVESIYLALLGSSAGPSWATTVSNLNNVTLSRDNFVNQVLASSSFSSGYGCGSPSDPNGQFIITLYHYGLNRCPTGYPSSGEYQYWESVLALPTSKSTVVSQVVYGNEFQADHLTAINAFLASQAQAQPSTTAVTPNPDTVPVLYPSLYRADFTEFEGGSEVSQATLIAGTGGGYNGNCVVQYSSGAQPQLALLNNGVSVGSGTMGQQVGGADLVLYSPQCNLDVTASSVSETGTQFSLFVDLSFATAGSYSWYGQAKAAGNGVTGPLSGSLASLTVTGSMASAIPQKISGVASPSYYVLNNWYNSTQGTPQTWAYCLGNGTTCYGNGVLSAQTVSGCQASDPNVTATITYPSTAPGHADSWWDVTFTATSLAVPAIRGLTCTYNGQTVSLGNAVTVYDASPQINTQANGVQKFLPDGAGGLYVTIFGPISEAPSGW